MSEKTDARPQGVLKPGYNNENVQYVTIKISRKQPVVKLVFDSNAEPGQRFQEDKEEI